MSIRRRLYRQLEPAAWPRRGLSPVNSAVAALILASTTLVAAGTESTVVEGRERLFLGIELVVALVFAIEYVARIWAAGEDPRYAGWRGRIAFAFTPMVIVDLIALVALAAPPLEESGVLLRLLRLARILRLARLGQFSRAFDALAEAVRSRGYELAASAMIAGLVLLGTSTMLYLTEGAVQPDAFGSIPRAMWWSVATLTTVGYGDVYPITGLGRLLASATAIAGIGIIAMPTGILAAAFSDALQKRRAEAARRDPPT